MATKRQNKFHGNVPAWLSLADIQIDYFTQFVKAWIPFNAWFSTTYSHETSDREILTRIKTETNPFRDKIIMFLNGADAESIDFKSLLGKLHLELENNAIPSIEHRITFTNVVLEKNRLPLFSNFVTGNGYKYKVTISYDHTNSSAQKIKVEVLDVLINSGKMNYLQNDYDLDELKFHNQFKLTNIPIEKVRLEVQNEILNCYKQINPLKPFNLLVAPVRKSKQSGEFKAPANCTVIDASKHLYFSDNSIDVAKAIIEIFYNLRNVLFHGEINPSRDVQKIYKEAYHILYTLIKVLN